MSAVTQHYGLTPPVPFLDVHVERDNWMFVEPSAIRAAAGAGHRYATVANATLNSYFDAVLAAVRAGDRSRGLQLLDHLHEPNETRLGMTRSGVAGHGVGAGIGRGLWTELSHNPACLHALVVKKLEDIVPFIDGVGVDLISDIATRVLFGILGDFTADMITVHPSLGRVISTAQEHVWDIAAATWATRDITLPVADNRRLLLVPTEFAWPRALVTADSFYQLQALGRVQDGNTVYTADGKRLAPLKKDLRKALPDVRPTNVAQAIDAADHDGVSLTDRHRAYVATRFAGIRLDAADLNALI